MSHLYPTETQQLLDRFRIAEPPKELDLCDLIGALQEKHLLPCLVFHLNVFDLIKLFRQLLGKLEYNQKNAHPTYYHSLLAKQKQSEAVRILPAHFSV